MVTISSMARVAAGRAVENKCNAYTAACSYAGLKCMTKPGGFQKTAIACSAKRFYGSTSARSGQDSNKSLESTFQNQSKLPRLPIPSLEQTAEKYLKSCEPLVSAEQFSKTKDLLAEFIKEGGVGQKAQNRLFEVEQNAKGSWLEDVWLRYAYLLYREPSMINVNWWSEFVDHPSHPNDLLKKPPPKGVFSSFQVERAAGLITNMLNFKHLIDSETLSPDYNRTTPLCMNQYRNMFGISRVPGEVEDKVLFTFPSKATHIIVLARDQIYKVDVLRPNGDRVPLKELERVLYEVTKDSINSQTAEQPIGLLTAGYRDNWFQAYEHLSKLSKQNQDNFDVINTSLFALALDDHSSRDNIAYSHHQIFHNGDASNRWFDKTLHLVVASSGKAGINGEHSPLDAIVPGRLMDFLVESESAVDPANVVASPLPAPIKLKWTVDGKVTKYIRNARETAKELIKDTASIVLQTDIYGSRYAKEVAKTSPDTLVQIAIQLAWKRLHSHPTAVYESASTRMFHHGRTETGRSMTSETWAFVHSFDDDNILYDDKREMYQRAAASQSSYIREATQGKGVDRHLLMLKTLLTPEELAGENIFNDFAYKESSHFRLSTSNVSPGRNWVAGFGPVVADGYGVAYAIDEHSVKFALSAKRSCATTNVHRFREVLEQSFKDLMILFPKRSQVWGKNWREDLKREDKHKYFLKRMQKLSDEFEAKKELFAKKYVPKADADE